MMYTHHDAHRGAADGGTSSSATQLEPVLGARTVRVTLEAREADWEFTPGEKTRAWTFDGQVPGPTINARVGDVLEVRLVNRLPSPTTLHFHGIRLPASMDGTTMVQRPVSTGETFVYRFPLIDAGTFWYHPHLDEPEQVGRGLYGALVVRGEDEPVLDRERVLVLSDTTLDVAGQVVRGAAQGKAAVRTLRLVNGSSEPELSMWGGQIERWRIVNAASARYVRLAIGGRPFRLLGTGGGLLEAPVTVTEALIVPGDRIEIAVGPFDAGESIDLSSHGHEEHEHERFASLVVGPEALSRAMVPSRMRTIEPIANAFAAPTRRIELGSAARLREIDELFINGELHHHDDDVRVGELQVWEIVNRGAEAHPFHLHGFFFQILERDGVPPAYRSWEDTVDVPAGSRVRIAWLPDDRPGDWMYHCHILEHHAAGMMAHFTVVRA